MHDVRQVSEADYEACNGKSPIASFTSGADSITLKEPGKTYFLCSFTGHCQMGQKLKIDVVGSAASPGDSPAASPEGAAAPKSAKGSSSGGSAADASTPTASAAEGVAPTAPTSSESSSTKLTAGLVSAVLSVAAAFAF